MDCKTLISQAQDVLTQDELMTLKRLMNKAVLGHEIALCNKDLAYAHTPITRVREASAKLPVLMSRYQQVAHS